MSGRPHTFRRVGKVNPKRIPYYRLMAWSASGIYERATGSVIYLTRISSGHRVNKARMWIELSEEPAYVLPVR